MAPGFTPAPTTCHLECHPDYIPSHSTSSTCLLGAWSSSSTCVSALALIRGRNSLAPYNTVEIYGAGMHEKLPELPDDRMYCVSSRQLRGVLRRLLHRHLLPHTPTSGCRTPPRLAATPRRC